MFNHQSSGNSRGRRLSSHAKANIRLIALQKPDADSSCYADFAAGAPYTMIHIRFGISNWLRQIRSMSTTVQIAGRPVPVTASCSCDLEAIVKCPNFVNWTKRVDSELDVRSIDVQSVDMFGNGRIGFVKFKSLVFKKSVSEGRHIPGIVFMRGPSVAILLVLCCEGEKYTVVTRQPRVPIADSCFTEIPAGVFDGDQFSGVAAKELKEEVGIVIDSSQLVDMTKAVYGDKYPGIYPSPGGCDEFIKLFLYEKEVTREELDSYRDKATGLMEEGEYICLKVIPLESLLTETSDAKALCALSLYHYLSSTHSLVCLKKHLTSFS